jgi:hypothetical protein
MNLTQPVEARFRRDVRTLDGGHGIRIDLDERRGLIGLENTAPSAVTVSASGHR